MSTVTDNDLKELKELIKSVNEKIDNRYNSLDSKLNDMRVDMATLKEGQKGINERLSNLEFTNRGILISVVGGLFLATLTVIFKFLTSPIG